MLTNPFEIQETRIKWKIEKEDDRYIGIRNRINTVNNKMAYETNRLKIDNNNVPDI